MEIFGAVMGRVMDAVMCRWWNPMKGQVTGPGDG
jgi:hypothetical protein